MKGCNTRDFSSECDRTDRGEMLKLSRRQFLTSGVILAGALGAGALGVVAYRHKPGSVVFDAVVFGADPTGTIDSSGAINEALEAGSGRAPVSVPPGSYLLNAAIRVPSNTTLILDPRAHMLRNHSNATLVNSAFASSGYHSLGGRGDSNITVVGGVFGLGPDRPVGQHLVMAEVSNLRVLGVGMQDAPSGAYMLWLINVHGATIADCVLDNHDTDEGLNDGIHIDSGKHVLVTDTYVRTGDDAIALGNLAGTEPLEDVTISNCTLYSGRSRALAIYTQNGQEMRNIHVSNVYAAAWGRGASVELVDYYNDNRYQSTVLADRPQSYYRMKETSGAIIKDDGSAGRSATLTSTGIRYGQRGALRSDTSPSSSSFNPGHNYDNCLGFDGKSGEAVAPDFWLAGGSFSFECFIKTATTALATVLYIKPLGVYVDGRTDGGVVIADDYGESLSAATPVNDGAWHHLVVTYDSASKSARIYIDGALSAASYVMYASMSAGALRIASNDGGQRLSGMLDEIAIYPYELAPERVLAHYRQAMRPRLIHGVDLTGLNVNSSIGVGVVVTRCSDIALRRANMGRSSVSVADAERVRLEDDTCYSGTWSSLVTIDTVRDFVVVGGVCDGGSAAARGIDAVCVSGGQWQGAAIRGCRESGIRISDCTRLEISGCSVQDNGLYGVLEAGGSHWNAVVSNDLRANGAPIGKVGDSSLYSGNLA